MNRDALFKVLQFIQKYNKQEYTPSSIYDDDPEADEDYKQEQEMLEILTYIINNSSVD